MKCDNCSFEADLEKDPHELDEVWCDECIHYDMLKWRAVICTKCYNKDGKLEIWKTHVEEAHSSVDLV